MHRLVPIVDISSWIEHPPHSVGDISLAQQQVVDRWHAALTTVGFTIITSTGVDATIMKTLKHEGEEFFSQSHQDKMVFNHGAYGHPNGGYSPFGIETVAKSMSNTDQESDPVENFVFRDNPLNFVDKNGQGASPIPTAHSYYHAMESLLGVLHQITSVALKLDDLDYISKYYADQNGNALRLSHYMAPQTVVSPEDSSRSTLYGAHTDYQGFTILRPDDSDWDSAGAGGLQVFIEEDNCWINVKIPDEIKIDAFVVNSGDLIERWTNRLFKSTLHRVLGPVRNSSSTAFSRLSVVYFTGPRHDAVIEVLPGMPGEAGLFPPVTAGEYLMSKLKKTNV